MNSETNSSQDRLPLKRYARARSEDDSLANTEPLSYYREVHAWVLLADPGAGKSDAFEALSRAEGGHYIRARDFVELDLPSGWSPPVFIDGLDEIAAGNATGLTVLGQIRTKLQQLGVPRFRISCREADWRGNADSDALKRLLGDGRFLELHLDPLDISQTKALIAHWQGSDEIEAEKFIHEAENRDLEGLLDNPQTLRMLVKAMAITGSGWPDSKTKTYEMACAQLVKEHNDEHIAAKRLSSLPHDKVLQAAGYLGAIMLLSGSESITSQSHDAKTGAVPLPELLCDRTAPDPIACQVALQTRLFRGNGRRNFFPIHRTVAEYLGAQYLISRFHNGLPPNRALMLMLGLDAGVVPALRGLHAWLAAIAPTDLRRELIDHDPLGLVLNGDVHNFTHAEKLHVLSALHDEAKRYAYFRSQNWASKPFGALATIDMMEDFRERLRSSDRSPAHLAMIDCVLDAVANGHPMPGLTPELEQVVRDKTYWPSLRTDALNVLIAYTREASTDWSTLTQVLTDIQDDAVEDLEDELLGSLLQALYPTHLSPTIIWKYFRRPKSDQLLGAYWTFWHDLAKTSLQDVPVLLDALTSTGFQLSDQHDHLGSPEIVGALLVRCVENYGAQAEVPRLYAWLSLGMGPHYHSYLEEEHKAALSQWLKDHPAAYKHLFEHWLSKQADDSQNSGYRLWQIRAQLYFAQAPDDATFWYLSLAETVVSDEMRRQLVMESFQQIEKEKGPDAAIRMLEKWSTDHVGDADWTATYLTCPYPPPSADQEYIDSEIKRKKNVAHESQQRIDFFRKALPSFETGPAHLGALVQVAYAYLDFFRRSNDKTPESRLVELLDNNEVWAQLALRGLRQSLFRTDLPSAKEIIDLSIQSQRYNLSAPCMAAMDLRYRDHPSLALDLPISIIESVSAFHLTNNYQKAPAWFKHLLGTHTGVLTKVLLQLISRQIAAKAEHVEGLYSLARDGDYAKIATQITPVLIRAFPIKASKGQLKNLRLLIVAMFGRLDRNTQFDLVAEKLGVKLMDVAQRVYWLTAGMQLAPDLYLDRAKTFVQKTQARAAHVFAMINERQERGNLHVALPIAAQEFLIELLGPSSSPKWPMRSGPVAQEMEMGRFVEGLISGLAGNPDNDATKALTALLQLQNLKHWEDAIRRALYDQRTTKRKALFKPASVAQVCATLANLKPASAADLWALTVDHLTQLVREIRHGNTNDYRQYWAADNPRLEDECRDTLLSDLKVRLAPLSVLAEPEGRYADEKRADVKVMSSPYQIPIEIKCEWHPQVWNAIREQLVGKYSRETASDGYGIFLVFWFTGNLKAAPSDGGQKPKTPKELQQRLAATLPEELRHKIAVLIVDCSKK